MYSTWGPPVYININCFEPTSRYRPCAVTRDEDYLWEGWAGRRLTPTPASSSPASLTWVESYWAGAPGQPARQLCLQTHEVKLHEGRKPASQDFVAQGMATYWDHIFKEWQNAGEGQSRAGSMTVTCHTVVGYLSNHGGMGDQIQNNTR